MLYIVETTIMKSSIAIFVLCAIFQINAKSLGRHDAPIDENQEYCINKLHLDKDVIESLNKVAFSPEDNDVYNKFMGCYGVQSGLMDENGNMDYTAVKNQLIQIAKDDPDTTSDLLKIYTDLINLAGEHCRKKAIKGTSNGQTVVKNLNCILKEMSEILQSA